MTQYRHSTTTSTITETKPGKFTDRLLLTASLAALIVAYPAFAQDDSDPNTAVEVAASDAETEDDVRTEDKIIVTGSRLARGNFDTPSPVTTLDSEHIEESGFVTLSDVLQRSPAIAVGQGIANAQTAGETAGATFANLRGLGSFRTLTLVNGHRRVPGALTTSSVDLSSIPPSMVERVEIVTGGTSAVYGADAVTGVINVILKRDFEGLEFDFSAGIPEAGGGGNAQQASIHWGTSFMDDRANFNVGLSYYNTSALRASEREFSSGQNYMFFQTNVPGDSFNGEVPTFSVRRDPTTFLFAETGTFFFWNGSAYEYYTVDPELRMQQNDAPPFFNSFNGVAGNGWATGGDGFAFDKYGLLRGGFESYNTMANFTFDINQNAKFYVDAELAITETESPFQPNFHPASGDSIFLFRDNPLLTPGTTAFMDANGLTSLFVFRTQDDLGVRETDVDRVNYNLLGGFKGTMNNGWDYDVFAQKGQMDIDTNTSNTLLRANYLNAIDVISDPGTGNPVCRDPAAVAAGCTPLVVLGRNSPLTQAQRDYVLYTKQTDLKIDQTVFGGQATGELYTLPAGPIGAAIGFEYRDESLSFRDDPRNQANELLLNAPTEDIDGGFDVKEVFAEVIVPLVADKPGIKELNVEAAVRYSDYSHAGDSTTWKLGASWTPTDDVRFRYTRSRSVRAPTVTDVFSPGITSFAFVSDPCDATIIGLLNDPTLQATRTANCAALGLATGFTDPSPTITKQVITGGNPNLKPEESDSWTIGMILEPSVVDGLRVSVDYWDIELTEAISQLGVGEILNNCVDFSSINNEFCPLVTRNTTTGEIISIENLPVNIDQETAKGVDVQAQYNFNPSWVPGNVEVGGGVTYLDELNFLDVSPTGSTLSEEAGEVQGTPLPKWRGNFNVAYNDGPLRVSWFGNYIGSMEIDNSAAPNTYQSGFDEIDSLLYHYLYAHYEINDQLTIRGGVNNLLNDAPPANPFTFLGAGGLYDNNGRYFWIGGTATF